VLFIINSLAGGGAERVLLSLLANSGDMVGEFDFSLALLDQEQRDYSPQEGLRVHQLDSRFKLSRSIFELRRLLAAERPDVTVAFLNRANVASVIAARLLGHRAVISERANTSSHLGSSLSGRVAKAIVRRVYPKADHVIAVSQGIAGDLIANFRVDPARMSTISNPVDAPAIQEAGAEPFDRPVNGPYAVAVSRLTKAKNPIMLVDALAASGSDLSLVILGQGPERDAIRARADELGLAERVVLPGFVANPYPIVRAATCYLSASNGEGFPNGLVEALALGVPAAVTNCASGPSEILADMRREDVPGLFAGQYGLLVPTNDKDAMAEAIRRVTLPDTAAALAAAGPLRAAQYGPDQAKALYWDVIRAVLDKS
jgi:N-acetylgalactosamine-N,N'-diacetylbacillosaminyl-diphospho-undecaprenol 4-alpha-N-acetylgalactosaminyltransferase